MKNMILLSLIFLLSSCMGTGGLNNDDKKDADSNKNDALLVNSVGKTALQFEMARDYFGHGENGGFLMALCATKDYPSEEKPLKIILNIGIDGKGYLSCRNDLTRKISFSYQIQKNEIGSFLKLDNFTFEPEALKSIYYQGDNDTAKIFKAMPWYINNKDKSIDTVLSVVHDNFFEKNKFDIRQGKEINNLGIVEFMQFKLAEAL